MARMFSTAMLFFFVIAADSAELAGLTRELDGTEIEYKYTGGNAYRVKFRAEGMSYRFLSGSKPDKWWGPFPYQARKLGEDRYLASWYEQGYGDYITLLIYLDQRILYGSGIIAGKNKTTVHFQGALISEIDRAR